MLNALNVGAEDGRKTANGTKKGHGYESVFSWCDHHEPVFR